VTDPLASPEDGYAGRVVAGVDGSDASLAALRWAVGHARRTGALVEAVTAWMAPTAYDWLPEGSGVDFEGAARQILDDALGAVAGLAPGVPLLRQVSPGHAAEVLVRASKGADLLVLGCRGRGGFAAQLVGSVSLHCVMRAHCPVLVLKQTDQVPADGR
jgi:nucleotide-binding universal stress UspA family protein